MSKAALNRSGKLAELLVAYFEEVLAPDVQVTWRDHIRGRKSGQLREVDVTLRRRVGTADVLIAFECRDRKAPADVRWIEELASKRDEIGAAVIVAVSTSGFTRGARRCAEGNSVLLRELTQINSEEIDRWFVRPQISVPMVRFLGAVAETRDPTLPILPIPQAELDGTARFRVPPTEEPCSLRALCQKQVEAMVADERCVVRFPRGATRKPLFMTMTPESKAAEIITPEGKYPLSALIAAFEVWMEPLQHAFVDARQYADEEGVLVQETNYVYSTSDGVWMLHVTEQPAEGEKYLFKHTDTRPGSSS